MVLPRSRYSRNEVRRLIESYAKLREAKDTSNGGLHSLIALTDLNTAIDALPPKAYQVVLLHGLLGYTTREVGTAIGTSNFTVHARYVAGVAWITRFLNNGGTF